VFCTDLKLKGSLLGWLWNCINLRLAMVHIVILQLSRKLKKYVVITSGCLQDRIHEHAQEFLDLMASDDAIFYFCGLKRMYSSVLEMLEVRHCLYYVVSGCYYVM
jgi:hypothetical protein